MDWTQTYTIIGVIVALFGILATIIVWSINKVDSDIQGLSRRVDSDFQGLGRRMDGHAQRIDQLYKMFVDLLQARK